jgi:hypothetical protein
MAKLAIALALVLVFASIQCVTLCAAPADAPCPHHQKTISACSHELVYVQSAAVLPAPHVAISFAWIEWPQESHEALKLSPAIVTSPPLRL